MQNRNIRQKAKKEKILILNEISQGGFTKKDQINKRPKKVWGGGRGIWEKSETVCVGVSRMLS